jgi:hypothetical protein
MGGMLFVCCAVTVSETGDCWWPSIAIIINAVCIPGITFLVQCSLSLSVSVFLSVYAMSLLSSLPLSLSHCIVAPMEAHPFLSPELTDQRNNSIWDAKGADPRYATLVISHPLLLTHLVIPTQSSGSLRLLVSSHPPVHVRHRVGTARTA